MSDLLAHLVARLTSPPVIQPRLEPLFFNAPAIDEIAPEMVAPPRSASPPAHDVVATKPSSVSPTPPVEMAAETPERVIEHAETVPERRVNEKPASLPKTLTKKSNQPPTPLRPTPPTKKEAVVVAKIFPRVKTSRQLAPQTKPASVRFEKEQPTSAAPIVRVTIGRIEVRAAPAPTPTRKTVKSAPPALTLEAYLNSRKGGAR